MSGRYQSGLRSGMPFRILEVVTMKKTSDNKASRLQVMLVDGEDETIRFVQENMDEFIGNLLKMRRLEEREHVKPGHACSLNELRSNYARN